jgi:hypothetical protein
MYAIDEPAVCGVASIGGAAVILGAEMPVGAATFKMPCKSSKDNV